MHNTQLPAFRDPPIAAVHDDSSRKAMTNAGDVAALEVIFRRHYASLCTHVAVVIGSPTDAEHVVRETFVDMWTTSHGTRRDAASREGGQVSMRAQLYRQVRATAERRESGRRVGWRDAMWTPGRGEHALSFAEMAAALDISMRGSSSAWRAHSCIGWRRIPTIPSPGSPRA